MIDKKLDKVIYIFWLLVALFTAALAIVNAVFMWVMGHNVFFVLSICVMVTSFIHAIYMQKNEIEKETMND